MQVVLPVQHDEPQGVLPSALPQHWDPPVETTHAAAFPQHSFPHTVFAFGQHDGVPPEAPAHLLPLGQQLRPQACALGQQFPSAPQAAELGQQPPPQTELPALQHVPFAALMQFSPMLQQFNPQNRPCPHSQVRVVTLHANPLLQQIVLQARSGGQHSLGPPKASWRHGPSVVTSQQATSPQA